MRLESRMSQDIISDAIDHTFDHAEFGRLRVYERPNGQVLFNLEDVARALGMTAEEAASAAGAESVGSVSPVMAMEEVRAFDREVEAL